MDLHHYKEVMDQL